MSVITRVPEPNLWDDILKDFNLKRPPYKDDDAASVHTTLENFDPAIHNPVFYGKMNEKMETDVTEEIDPATTHPAFLGHALVDRPPQSPTPPPKPLPDLKKCSPRDYLEAYVFPVLLPALEEMLRQAKTEKCFERKRTKFNGCDFLTEYLYNHNTAYTDRDNVTLGDIPFVAEHWKLHPRPPLPKSLLWTEEEATLIIQSHFRGFKVRTDPEIQELRNWQREWREENANIKNKVDDFWAKQMPDGEETNPNADQEGSEDGKTSPIQMENTVEEPGSDDNDDIEDDATTPNTEIGMGNDMESTQGGVVVDESDDESDDD